ncbi:MAG: hypothetical protein JWO30_3158 [Fibrobacteres bacterium]|nr:hypothetical protein [Fibrobacterota bacterium]
MKKAARTCGPLFISKDESGRPPVAHQDRLTGRTKVWAP